MRIDLHTHSRVSDGTDSPTELVQAAKAADLDVVAITDHDTAASWDEATAAAAEAGIELVRGMEISTDYVGHSVHLLAYLPDRTHPPLDCRSSPNSGRLGRTAAADAGPARRGSASRCRSRTSPQSPATPPPPGAAAPGRRARREGVRAQPRRGVQPLPRSRQTGERQPLRGPARADDPHRRRCWRSHRDRPSLGPVRTRAARRGSPLRTGRRGPVRARGSTTRITARKCARSCG